MKKTIPITLSIRQYFQKARKDITSFHPLEIFCLGVVLILVFIAYSSFFFFILSCSELSILSVLAVFGIVYCIRKHIARIIKHLQVAIPVKAFLLLLSWSIVWILLIRNFSGGSWQADWLEHYQRALYFNGQLPMGVSINGGVHVSARPPLMNLIQSCFIYYFPENLKFCIYQILSAILSNLVFFPCCLLISLNGGLSTKRILFLCSLFALNPFFLQNATYPWTKSLASFFIILGLYFYIKFINRHLFQSLIFSFICLAIGALVHYSAVPYILFFLIHLYFFEFESFRHRSFLYSFLPPLILIFILMPWFLWSFIRFGIVDTFTSNSTFEESAKYSIPTNISKFIHNIFSTFIPHPFRMDSFAEISSAAGTEMSFHVFLRDYFFNIYQTNLFWAIGTNFVIFGIMIVLIKFGDLINNRRNISFYTESRTSFYFWELFFIFNIFLGIGVHGAPDSFGLAHITLQPIVLICISGLVFFYYLCLKTIRILFITFTIIDSIVGILLHQIIQSKAVYFSRISDRIIALDVSESPKLGMVAFRNAWFKYNFDLTFAGDIFSKFNVLLFVIALLFLFFFWFLLVKCASCKKLQVKINHANS